MADDVELIALARERILEMFQIERFTAGSARNVSRRPRRVRNPTTRVGKVFDFSVHSVIIQYRETKRCEFDCPCNNVLWFRLC